MKATVNFVCLCLPAIPNNFYTVVRIMPIILTDACAFICAPHHIPWREGCQKQTGFLKVHKGTMDNRSCSIPLGINKNKTQFTWTEKHCLSRCKPVADRLQMTFGFDEVLEQAADTWFVKKGTARAGWSYWYSSGWFCKQFWNDKKERIYLSNHVI